MPEPVVIQMQVGGVADVQKALRSVEQALVGMEGRVTKASGSASKTRVKAAQDEAKEGISAAQKWAKAREGIVTNSAKYAARYAAEEVAKEKQAADEKIRAAEQWAKRRAEIQTNSAKLAGRLAKQEADAEARARKQFATGITGRSGNAIGSVMRGATGLVGSVLAVGGGFTIADSVQSTVRNRGKAMDLQNQSGGTTSASAIFDKASSVGTAYGMESGKVIEGLDAFVAKSGDVKSGFKMINQLVELATATGADLGEISRTAGIVHMSTGSAEGTMSVMREMAGMGRAGSVDMREMQEYAGRITAGAGLFGDKRGAMTSLGAIVQQSAATGGSASAAEATEAIGTLGRDIFKKEGAWKSHGIKTRDKTGKFLRGPEDLIKEALTATGGDRGKLQSMFGLQSIRAVAGYADVYNRASQASKDAGGNKAAQQKAGLDAVDATFANFTKIALKEQQVKEEAMKRIQEADKQFESVLNELRDATGRELLPEFIKLIPEIRRLIPEFVNLLRNVVALSEWFAENPLKGIGAVMAAAVVKDIGSAAVGKLVAEAIVALMSRVSLPGGGVGGPVVAGAGGAAGGAGGVVAGTVAAGAAAGLSLYGMVKSIIDTTHQTTKTETGVKDTINEFLLGARDIRRGKATPEQIKALKQRRDETRAKIAAAKGVDTSAATGLHEGLNTVAENASFGLLGDTHRKNSAKIAEATTIQLNSGSLEAAMKAWTDALEKSGRVADNSDPNTPGRNQPMSSPARGGAQ